MKGSRRGRRSGSRTGPCARGERGLRLWIVAGCLVLAGGSSLGAEKELTLLPGKAGPMRLVRIPAGKFLMGSVRRPGHRGHRNERPQHEVTIAEDFYVGRHEVTRGQFAAFVRGAGYKSEAETHGWAFAWTGTKWDRIQGASWRNVGFQQTDKHPVVCVSWTDATEFCKWLSGKAGRAIRLPTETQWEYACRAGSTTAWSWGDKPAAGKGHCNAADQTGKAGFRTWRAFSWKDGYVFTSPVGTFKANAFGLCDMHGNVWEWCRDAYRKDYSTDGAVKATVQAGVLRAVRGGSWLSPPSRCRSAFRAGSKPMGSYCDFILGFRVAADRVAARSGS